MFERKKDKLAIVGMAQTNRSQAPFDDPEWEIWSLNEAYFTIETQKGDDGKPLKDDAGEKIRAPFLKRWDVMFQLHPRWDYEREHNFNHPNHWPWLLNKPMECRTCHGRGYTAVKPNGDKVPCPEPNCQGGTYVPGRPEDFPVLMLYEDERVTGSTAYPFSEIVDAYGVNKDNVRFFTSSFAYMMAMAIHMGYPTIGVWGFEMSSQEEYGNQKPCADFWIGVAVGKGIEIVQPENCSLLGLKEKLYGYEKLPGFTAMHAEIQFNQARKNFEKAQKKVKEILMTKSQAERGVQRPHAGSTGLGLQGAHAPSSEPDQR